MPPLPAPITSRTNARVKALRAAFSGKAGRAGELTAIEGEHLLAEAASAGLQLETIFVCEGRESLLRLASLAHLRAREHLVLSRDVFDSVVEAATPQGIAGTLAIPDTNGSTGADQGAILVLENVQDPGNVGTLIRSAAAFGAECVLLVGECANPWSPKVLRASVGAVFHIPVSRSTLAAAIAMRGAQRRVLAAVAGGQSAIAPAEALTGAPLLLIGSEGRGLSREALAAADLQVKIPCRIESLNAAVAGSILLYQWSCQQQGTDRSNRLQQTAATR
jgi:RNA methyltransferase, TrmH family